MNILVSLVAFFYVKTVCTIVMRNPGNIGKKWVRNDKHGRIDMVGFYPVSFDSVDLVKGIDFVILHDFQKTVKMRMNDIVIVQIINHGMGVGNAGQGEITLRIS
jgi:hypothetical protein